MRDSPIKQWETRMSQDYNFGKNRSDKQLDEWKDTKKNHGVRSTRTNRLEELDAEGDVERRICSGLEESKLHHELLVSGGVPSCGLCWPKNLQSPVERKNRLIHAGDMVPIFQVKYYFGVNSEAYGSSYL